MNKKTDFWSGLKLVFKNRNYVILALLMSLVFWLIVAVLSQYSWLKLIVTASWLSFFTKISLFFSALFNDILNFTTVDYVVYIAMALLAGINMAVVIYNTKNYLKTRKMAGIGVGAMILGILGVGCASCGSVLLTSIIGVSSVASTIHVLPLKGMEINLLVILILVLSIYLSAKQINKNFTCKIKSK